ncbi:hypothetical protein A2U01_0098316, partial [Trifolium medium]|nr:hypothetical protein [Trifolium medium]
RDVNLHPSKRILAEIAPFGAPKTGIFSVGTGMKAKTPPQTLRGRDRGRSIRPADSSNPSIYT